MGGQLSKPASVANVFQRDDPSAVEDLLTKWRITPLDLLRPLLQEHIASLQIDKDVADMATNKLSPGDKQLSLVGDTPLHVAAELENAQILRAMVNAILAYAKKLQKEATDEEKKENPVIDWDVRDSSGLSPFSRAVRNSNVTAIQLLIDVGADPFLPYSTTGKERWETSYLRYAAWHGKSKVVDAFLTVKGISTAWDRDGKRAIHLAIENGKLDVVEVLLQQDLDKYCDDKCDLIPDYSEHALTLAIDRFIVRAPNPSPVQPSSRVRALTSGLPDRSTPRREAGVQSGLETAPGSNELLQILRGALRNELQSLTRVSVPATESSAASTHQNNSSFIQQSLRDRGSSLLHLAATYGQTTILEYLLSHPAFSEAHSTLNEFGKAPIFMAVRHGHLDCLKALQARGISLKAADIENWTIIHEAVKYRHIDILNYILINDGDVNCDDDDGWTPLHVAARFGVWTAVAPLISAGADINARTDDNETALQLTVMQSKNEKMLSELLRFNPEMDTRKAFSASPERLLVERGDFSVLTILLEHLNKKAAEQGDSVSAIKRVLRDGKTLLHRCVTGNATSAVKHLLQLGVDDTFQNGSGETALYYAARKDMHEMVKTLLENNANPDAPHKDGTAPLHVSCDFGNAKIVELLLAHGSDAESIVPEAASNSGFTPLMLAARRGHNKCIKILVQFGVSLNTQKGDGYTALHLAALNGHITALTLLMRGWADSAMKESHGFLPLHVSVRNQQFEATVAMLSAGANAAAVGPAGLVSLHFAAYVCDARTIWLLLQCGVSVGCTDDNGAGALHYAARQERGQSCIQLLLTSGANINLQDIDGDSALHCAAQAGAVQNARVLLKRGADPGLKNETGLTALHTAVAQGSEALVEILLRFGADGRIKDLNGTTPYQLATMARNQPARILIWRALKLTADDVAPIAKHHVEAHEVSRGILRKSGSEGEERVEEREGVICVVCQNGLRFDEDVRTLRCSHVYHGDCILGWWGGPLLSEHQTCPLCNASVLPPDLPERTGS